MDQNNGQPRYRGTKGLSLAIVIGVAIGTAIGKLMDNMNTGLMLGLVIGVAAWALLFNRKQDGAGGAEPDTEQGTSKPPAKPDTDGEESQNKG